MSSSLPQGAAILFDALINEKAGLSKDTIQVVPATSSVGTIGDTSISPLVDDKDEYPDGGFGWVVTMGVS